MGKAMMLKTGSGGALSGSFADTPGQVNVAYSSPVATNGGSSPYSYSVFSGSLPPGLSLSGNTVSGTPTTAGIYTFVIRVTDSTSSHVDVNCQIAIASQSGQGNVGSGSSTTVPPGNLISTFSIDSGIPTGTSQNPYNAPDQSGLPYFHITGFSLDDSPCLGHPEVNRVIVTAQDFDASGNAIGPEQLFAWWSFDGVGGVHKFGPLDGRYLEDGDSYTRTGDIASVHFKVYLGNSSDMSVTAFTNASATTVQSTVGGGAGYIQATVASGGQAPPGAGADYTGNRTPGDTRGRGHQFGQIGTDSNGRTRLLNDNLGNSLIADPSFKYATPGQFIMAGSAGQLNDGWSWQAGSTGLVEVLSGDGNSDDKCVRLTGPYTMLAYEVSVQPGSPLYVQVAVKSNTPGGSHSINVAVLWEDANHTVGTNSVVGSVNTPVASWSAGPSGTVVAPAGAAYGLVIIYTDPAESSSGQWYVDDVFVQPVINQSNKGQTTSTVPTAGSNDYSSVHGAEAATNDKSYYGLRQVNLSGSDGSYVQIQSGGSTYQKNVLVHSPFGTVQLVSDNGSSGGSPFLEISLSDASGNNRWTLDYISGVGFILTIAIGGVSYTGYTGTVQSAYSLNKPVKNGFICN